MSVPCSKRSLPKAAKPPAAVPKRAARQARTLDETPAALSKRAARQPRKRDERVDWLVVGAARQPRTLDETPAALSKRAARQPRKRDERVDWLVVGAATRLSTFPQPLSLTRSGCRSSMGYRWIWRHRLAHGSVQHGLI